MSSDIPRQTAAIFFSIEPLSKTEYWLGVCHGWLNLHGLLRAQGGGHKIYKMKNSSCP